MDSVLELRSLYSAPFLHGRSGGGSGLEGMSKGGFERDPPQSLGFNLHQASAPWACWCVVFHTDVPQQLEIVRREEAGDLEHKPWHFSKQNK